MPSILSIVVFPDKFSQSHMCAYTPKGNLAHILVIMFTYMNVYIYMHVYIYRHIAQLSLLHTISCMSDPALNTVFIHLSQSHEFSHLHTQQYMSRTYVGTPHTS